MKTFFVENLCKLQNATKWRKYEQKIENCRMYFDFECFKKLLRPLNSNDLLKKHGKTEKVLNQKPIAIGFYIKSDIQNAFQSAS